MASVIHTRSKSVPKGKTIFTLRCVGCKMKEDRPAQECYEQPFCKKCHNPMYLVKVTHGR